MISYGGIPLVQPTPELAEWLRLHIRPDDAFGFYRPRWLGDPDLRASGSLNWFLSRQIKINSFFNPWGAARWGIAYGLADDRILDSIRTQAVGTGTSYTALPLVISDGDTSSITTNLSMLPAVPLSAFLSTTPRLGLHLLVLVDARFFWWERADAIAIDPGTTTWAQLYSAIASGLGITLTADPVSADYLKPAEGLSKEYDYLPLLLDWVASCVGQRIVRTLDGSFYARSATSAKALMLASANSYRKYAGGSYDLGVIDA